MLTISTSQDDCHITTHAEEVFYSILQGMSSALFLLFYADTMSLNLAV